MNGRRIESSRPFRQTAFFRLRLLLSKVCLQKSRPEKRGGKIRKKEDMKEQIRRKKLNITEPSTKEASRKKPSTTEPSTKEVSRKKPRTKALLPEDSPNPCCASTWTPSAFGTTNRESHPRPRPTRKAGWSLRHLMESPQLRIPLHPAQKERAGRLHPLGAQPSGEILRTPTPASSKRESEEDDHF